MQLVDILQYMNLKLPRNLHVFLVDFQGDFFSSLPNPMEADEEDLDCIPKSQFEEGEMSCSVVNNSGQFLAFISLLALLKGLLFGGLLLSPKGWKIEILMKKVNQFIGAGLIIDLIFGYEPDYMVAFAIELTTSTALLGYNVIGKVISVLGILVLCSSILFMALITLPYYRDPKKEAKKEWKKILKETIKEKCRIIGFVIIEIQAIRDLILPFFIVLLHDYPSLQILMTMACITFPIIFKLFTFPFDSKRENFASIANDLLYLIILAEFLILYLFRNTLSDKVKTGIGYLAIIQILLIVLCNALSALVIIGEPLYAYLKKTKAKAAAV